MNTRFWVGIHVVMLLAFVAVCWWPGDVLAADDPQDAPVASETRTTADVPSPDDAGPPKKDDDLKEGDDGVLQADTSLDLGSWVQPLLGVFSLVAEVVEAVMGDDMAVVLDDADAENMALEYVEQMRPQLKAELGFARLICGDLTPEQRQKIRETSEAAVKQCAIQLVKQEARAEQGKPVAEEPVDSGIKIREAINNAMKDVLSENQMAVFVEETEKRAAGRKQTIILNVVSQLDDQLFLSEDQRTKIQQRISSAWSPSWEKWLAIIRFGGSHCVPAIPDQCLVPYLNSDQKVVWKGLQKMDFQWWDVVDFVDQNEDADDWWGMKKDNVWRPDGVLIEQINGGGDDVTGREERLNEP